MRRYTTVLLCAALLPSACHKAEEDPEAQPVVSAKVETVVQEPFTITVGAIGTVTPRAGSYAVLSAPAQTRVLNVFHSEGDKVSAGTVLIELDHSSFDAEALKAQAALDAAQRAFDRADRLEKQGIVARKDVEAAAKDLADAHANLVNARRNQALATVRSPVNGVIAKLNAVLGSQVDITQPLVTIINPAAMQIDMDVPARDAGSVVPGNPIEFFAGQDSRGTPLGTGSVMGVAPDVDSVARSVAVRAAVTNPVRALRAGESVYARITVGVHRAAITVPIEALVPEGEGYKVFVVNKDDIALAREVTVGQRNEKRAEILTGLAAGERIVTYGAYGVEDSAKIQTKPDSSAKTPVKP
jgi:membrane fusion protein (multidrug efflux system)